MAQTLGHLLLNDVLPQQHKVTSTLGKSDLSRKMLDIAREDSKNYVQVVMKLKRLGDELSTLEGVSVGLDDIAPVYHLRDTILKPAVEAIKTAKSQAERESIIIATQEKLLQHTREHPGTMTQMALSGARGNIPQLMKTVASPVAATDVKGRVTPWLIGKSYSEGLSSADYWVAGTEARLNTIKGTTSVAEPGDVAKVLVNNMYPLVVTKVDCGTHNGIAVPSGDKEAQGRYLSKDQCGANRNDLVTAKLAATMSTKCPTIYVRSPLTCEADEGVCSKCQGLDEKHQVHAVGVNVGVRAAQSLSEPLTQMALSSKHSARVLKDSAPRLEGLSGVRQLLDVPQSFFLKATLTDKPGRVTKIEEAAHGGHYVHVDSASYYVPPQLKVKVSQGQVVEAGDALSEGIPKPDEVVKHKGLGAGRHYLVNALADVYQNSGVNVDRRHLELLARAELNHVRVTEHAEHHPSLMKGDVVTYNQYKAALSDHIKQMSLDAALNQVLGKEVLQYTVGTKITQAVLDDLRRHKVTSVYVAPAPPRVEFMMKPFTRNPLLNPDWMARMAHRFLKESLIKGVHYGDRSDLHGVNPVSAYAYGAEFGAGKDGRY